MLVGVVKLSSSPPLYLLFISLLLLFHQASGKLGDPVVDKKVKKDQNEPTPSSGKTGGNSAPAKMQHDNGIDQTKLYQKLLKRKHEDHLHAISTLKGIADKDKRRDILQKLLVAMEKVVRDAKASIDSSGFEPGGPLPHKSDEYLMSQISTVLENVEFLAELALRMPTPVTRYYRENWDFKELADWAYKFGIDTQVYDDKTKELLHLAGQELGLMEREESYVNPYREQEEEMKSKTDLDVEAAERHKAAIKQQKQDEKKKMLNKKKGKKGPKLSGGHRSEL